jgi:hypothetical protein
MEWKNSENLLTEVIGEIGQADGGMFTPPGKICVHEKKLFVLEDAFLRKMFALTTFYAREAGQLKVKLQYEPDNKELQIEFQKMDSKEDLLREMLWYCIRTKYDLWRYPSLGIREGWNIIEDCHEDGDAPEFLRKLLGS